MPRERPLLCLVTDRRRLTGSDDPVSPWSCLKDLAREAVDVGIDIFQVREGDLESAALFDLVQSLAELAKRSSTCIVVNDRLDIALAAGASGVHLRADSIAPQAVRSIVPTGFSVGRSVHDASEAAKDSAGTDYLIAGTVFPTASKPSGGPLLGITGLTEVVGATRVPVLAIGGMTVERASQVAATGAAGIAAIGLFLPSPGATMAQVVEKLRRQFDRPVRAS